MDIWIGIDGYLINHSNSSNRSLASGHTCGEEVNVIMLAQVIVNFCFNPACYFLNILYIFTVANSSC